MKFETDIQESHEAKLIVTVEAERFEAARKAAAAKIARYINVPGYRKGKAPFRVVASMITEEGLIEETLETLGQELYREALEQSDLRPYSAGRLDDFDKEKLTFTFSVPLWPSVELGDYESVRIEMGSEAVTDDQVDEQLERLRSQQAVMEPVERAIEPGDVALMNIVGTLVRPPLGKTRKKKADAESAEPETPTDDTAEEAPQNDTWLAREGVRVKIAEDSNYPVPGFYEHITGMTPEAQKTFTMKFAEDDERVGEALRGKEVSFDVTVQEVFSFEVPALDDEFAQSIGEYETLDDLRTEIRADLEHKAYHAAEDAYFDRVMEHLDSISAIKFPPIALENQIDAMVENFAMDLQMSGLQMEDYLKLQNRSKDEMREDFRATAIKRLRRSLILGEIASREQITIDADDVTAEIVRLDESLGTGGSRLRQMVRSQEMRDSVENRILTERVIRRITRIAQGKGDEPDSGDEHEHEHHHEAEPAESAGGSPDAAPATDTPQTPDSEAEPES